MRFSETQMKKTLVAVALLLFVVPSWCQDDTLLSGASVLTKGVTSGCISSWDRTGGNNDYVVVKAGQTFTLADIPGAGSIKHIWIVLSSPSPYHLRELVLRMYWDGEKDPSVESPLGDFFGTGFGQYHSFWSLPLTVHYRALNSYFDMPFGKGAKIEITNDGSQDVVAFYYRIDYESYADSATVAHRGRFHAQWRRQVLNAVPLSQTGGVNLTGQDNYVFMDAVGKGQLVGVVMNISGRSNQWWGEGDDMFFIDGTKTFPPSIHGTGLEDFFSNGWGYQEEFNYPFAGYSRKGNYDPSDWSGRHTMYRFLLQDPIRFEHSLKATIEHGNANDMEVDYSSVAYWYQTEPHKPFAPLPPLKDRIPNDNWRLEELNAPLPK